MSQIDIDSDGSVNIRKWLVAIGFDNPLTFTFLTAAGAAFDITGYVFSLQVKKKGQSSNLFNYTEGNGLTNNGAAGTLSSTALNYIHSATLKNRGEYFVQLSVTLPSGDKRRWHNGTVYASSELHDDTVASVSTTIDIGGTVISTTITNSTASFSTITGSPSDNAALAAALALKQALLNTAVALVDGATIDLTAIKHTLSTAASRTFTISYTGDDITLEVTLTAVGATQTFPAGSLCVSEGVASGDNLLAMAGVSGDKYMIAIKKVGSAYYVVCKNFGQ